MVLYFRLTKLKKHVKFNPQPTRDTHDYIIHALTMNRISLTSNLPETTLGLYIRDLRLKKRIPLRKFAEKLDELSKNSAEGEYARTTSFSPGFLSDIENGRRYPSEQVLELIAEILGVTVEELHDNDHRMPTEELQRLHAVNPMFGFAFRRAVNFIKAEKLTPEELLQRLGGEPQTHHNNQDNAPQ